MNLAVRFQLRTHMADLRLPTPASDVATPVDGLARFSDNLWQHTCFEAFIGVSVDGAHAAAYREFNFAPSGLWAAYDFLDYRQRNSNWQPSLAPHISVQQNNDDIALQAAIPRTLLPGDAASVLHIGLTAVLEAGDGSLSYWALHHPCDRPDFHHRAAFVLRLAHVNAP